MCGPADLDAVVQAVDVGRERSMWIVVDLTSGIMDGKLWYI